MGRIRIEGRPPRPLPHDAIPRVPGEAEGQRDHRSDRVPTMAGDDTFHDLFDRAVADLSAPGASPSGVSTLQDAWDRVVHAHAAGLPIEAVVRERLADGWRIDVFGLAGFLAVVDAAEAADWRAGEALRAHVLRFDRATGALRLWVRDTRGGS